MSKLFPHLASATVPGPSIAEGGGDGANPLPPGLLQRLLNFATAAEEASEAGTVSGAQLTADYCRAQGRNLANSSRNP